MSIAERIQSMTAHLSAAYAKLAEKGATIPQNKNIENLASAIDTITGGGEEYKEKLTQLIDRSLTSITIPESVTNIDNYAFSGCRSLTSITIYALTPPIIASATFNNVPAAAAIYVPASAVEAYKTAQYWSDRANYIYPIEGSEYEE